MTFLIALGLLSATVPEENYDFLSVTNGPCIPKFGGRIETKYKTECERMTEPRRYRGTWRVEFEGSVFTPAGIADCFETRGGTRCAYVEGKALPWPSRWACPRKYEVEFIGRRNVLPGLYGNAFDYRIVVDELIEAKRLPDPPHESNDCDEAAP